MEGQIDYPSLYTSAIKSRSLTNTFIFTFILLKKKKDVVLLTYVPSTK